jgi:hypothetical protein
MQNAKYFSLSCYTYTTTYIHSKTSAMKKIFLILAMLAFYTILIFIQLS